MFVLLAKTGKYDAAATGVRLAARLKAVVVTIISVLALLGILVGVYYARGQLREARRVREEDAKALARQHEAEREESEWANRYERLVSQLTKINPTLTVQPAGVPATQLYPSIFPDARIREALQTYIVELNDSTTQFLRRPNPRPDELRLTKSQRDNKASRRVHG
jgi:hypothetical protein